MGEVKYSVFMQTHLILAAGMERSPPVTRAGGGDNDIDEREVAAENSRAPSRARRSSLENDPFFARGPWATRTGTLTRLPSLVRPRPLTMPFGDVGMASGDEDEAAPRGRMVDGIERERLHEGRRLWTMGGDGGERRVRPRRGGVEKLWLTLFSSLPRASVESLRRNHMAGKKRYFPPQVGNIPVEAGKNSFYFPGQLYWAL